MSLVMIKENIDKYKSHLSDRGLTDTQQDDYIMAIAVFLDRIIEQNFNMASTQNAEISSIQSLNIVKNPKRTRTSNRLKYKRILKISQF